MKGGIHAVSVQVKETYLPPRALKSEIVRYFGYSCTYYFFKRSSFKKELEEIGINYDDIRYYSRLPFDVTKAIYERYNITSLS